MSSIGEGRGILVPGVAGRCFLVKRCHIQANAVIRSLTIKFEILIATDSAALMGIPITFEYNQN